MIAVPSRGRPRLAARPTLAHARARLSQRAKLCASLALLTSLGLGLPRLAHAQPADAQQEACLGAHERGQLERMHGRLLEARAQLTACSQASCPGVVRADCAGWLAEVERSLPSIVLSVADERGRDLIDAHVRSEDGRVNARAAGRAIPLDPGLYKLRIEAPGYTSEQRELSITAGERERPVRVVLRATATSAAAPAPARGPDVAVRVGEPPGARRARRLMLSGYVLGGLGLVSLSTGIALGALGKHKLDSLNDQGCAPSCDEDEVQQGRQQYQLANAMFATTSALLGAAVFTWSWGYFKRRDRERAPSPALSLAPRRNGLAVGWAGRF